MSPVYNDAVEIHYVAEDDDGTWDNPNLQNRSHIHGVLCHGWTLCLEYQAQQKGWTQEEIANDSDGVAALIRQRYGESIWQESYQAKPPCRWCLEVARS